MEQLKRIFATNTRALEIRSVMEGNKPVARIDAYDEEVGAIRKFCDCNKLHMSMSSFKLVKVVEKDKGSYANKAFRVMADSNTRGAYQLYISRDSRKADRARHYEEINDHQRLGLILGYPECCVKFFKDNFGEAENADLTMKSLERSEGHKFDYAMNFVARFFDYTLLSHFPCSLNCEKSLIIARKNLELVADKDEYLRHLRTAVLYTLDEGIFLLMNPRVDGNALRYSGVIATVRNDLYHALSSSGDAEVIDKNNLKAGGREVYGGFMVFA